MNGPVDVVDTPAEAAALPLPPLVVRRPLEAWLDEQRARAADRSPSTRIGAGHSNATFLLERGGERMVLRRPPRPPLPPSAHDMLREARVLTALEGRARVPRVLAVCQDEDVLGVPFYVMEELHGDVVTDALPAALGTAEARREAGHDLVDALVELHAVDIASAGLSDFGRPDGYLERQVRRFGALWEHNATRELPLVGELAAWLGAARAGFRARRASCTATTASATSCSTATRRACWRCSTGSSRRSAIRSPISATSSRPVPTRPRSPTVLDLSPVTRSAGFPDRAELVERYAERSGRSVGALAWYETLALWKAAVFCEGLYGRFLRGETADPWTGEPRRGRPGPAARGCGAPPSATDAVTSRRAGSARSARGRAP